MRRIQLAVDIGGTFTDGILQTPDAVFSAKLPTTPAAPQIAFLDLACQLLDQSGLEPADVDGVIHGTTLATNALIERSGAPTALITTAGFRDSLEIGYESRYDQYSLALHKPVPLIPRALRFTVRERVRADGSIDTPLHLEDLDAIVEAFAQQAIESVAVGLIHGYANPTHEQRIASHLRGLLPDLAISVSSVVCPEIREYERLSTTAADAYIKPQIDRYLSALERDLRQRGFACPLFLVTSAGGITGIDQARKRPISLVESGPSGGAILAEVTAERCGIGRALSYDMGGTTAKICLIDDFRSGTTREFETARSARFIKGSGLPLRIPVTEMIEIGAGGGSIAALDAMQRLQVGPHSAGSDPGPACYGRGGDAVTVSDADMLLGRLDPERFAEGRIQLSRERAATAVRANMDAADVVQAAADVTRVVDENMAAAARVHAVEHGADLRDYSMIAFGGAGPLHAASLARKLGIRRVIIPRLPGVGSAAGFLTMPVSAEQSHSLFMPLSALDWCAVIGVLGDLERSCADIVEQAAPGSPRQISHSALMRYAGQGHEIEVPLPLDAPDAAAAATVIEQRYRARYRQLYERDLDDGEIEILTFTARVTTARDDNVAMHFEDMSDRQQPRQSANTTTALYDPDQGQMQNAVVYPRHQLGPATRIDGPALINEAQTTTVVPEGFVARVDRAGHLLLEDIRDAVEAASGELSDIDLQVMWNRLQGMVDELASILMRTAFSPIVRESGDLSVGVFDIDGKMLAQAVTGTPGHVNTMAAACARFFDFFPKSTMRPGDLYLTNDPWEGSGHLNDFVLLRPCFHRDRLIGFVSCTSHLVDIGGRCLGPDGNDVFDEGLYIPHIRLVEQGALNTTLLALLKANSRSPLQAEGDLYALIACCEKSQERLDDILCSIGASDLAEISRRIIGSSQDAVRNRIRALGNGSWHYAMTVDGYEQPITIKASIVVDEESLKLDFYESAPLSKHGINVPLGYSIAYSVFGLKCAIAPDIPNNHGSLLPFQVDATPGTILNAPKPAPVCSRHILGQLLPDVALGCLAEALPGTIPAEGAATLWDIPIKGVHIPTGEIFTQELVFNGGTGARPHSDGLSATAFPSGVMGSLVEITESSTPLMIRRRELRPGSGGAGKFKGGHGQVIEIQALPNYRLVIYGTVDRVLFPAQGRQGGSAGAKGYFVHSAGTPFHGKGTCTLEPGETLTVYTPGGGGFGPPDGEANDL